MTDPKKFLLNSDYPNDQIVFLREGSQSVPDGTTNDLTPITIPHGLPFAPLPLLFWSNDSSFSTVNNNFDATYAQSVGSFVTFPSGQYYDIKADSTNVTITRYNNSGSTQTVYYRVICYIPSTASIDAVVENTSNQSDNLILSTDFNYMKLAFVGNLDGLNQSFDHNLGYIPTVLRWGYISLSGSYSPNVLTQYIPPFSFAEAGISVSTTQITRNNADNYDAIEYRIYLEDGTT